MGLGGLPSTDVPCQIHGKRDFLLCRFDVAHVEHPDVSGPKGVGLGQFGGDKRRRQRTEPDPAGRVAVVGQVIVNACTPSALLLLRIAQVAAIAVFVVRPQQRYIIGNLQSVVVGIEHFLVGAEHLGNFLYRPFDISAQHVALIVDGLLHESHAFLRGVGSLHGIVVNAAQSQRVGVLIASVGLDALLPVVLHGLAVGDVVEVAVGAHGFPLALVVAEHLFAMRSAHHDGIVVGQTGVLRAEVEGLRAGVHGGPQVVALQAEQQFEHFPVGLGSHLVVLFVEVLFSPAGPASETLIVDEDATVSDRRLPLDECSAANHQSLLMLGHNVGPPVPGRNADGFRERQQPEGRSAAVAANDDQCFADMLRRPLKRRHQERFPLAANLLHLDTPLSYQLIDDAALANGSGNDGIARLHLFQSRGVRQGRLPARHALHVVG